MVRKKMVMWHEEELTVKKSRYTNSDRLYLGLFDKDGYRYTDITINLPSVKLQSNEIVVKTYSENKGILQPLAEAGIIDINSCKQIPVGYTTASVCKLTIDENEIEEFK